MAAMTFVAAFLILSVVGLQYAEANNLGSGQRLNAGGSVVSSNGYYQFIMQTDGNLVLYRVSDHHALWSSKTSGKGDNCYVVMQGDGNLVVYDKTNLAIWSSKTSRSSDSYYLAIQNDGNVVIYTPGGAAIWATNTVQ